MSTAAPRVTGTIPSQTADAGFRMPEGPKSSTLVNGLMFLVARNISARRMSKRYGDAYTLKLPVIGTTVVVANPDLVKAVFTAKPDVLHGGKNPLGAVLGPGSLFSLDEDRHLEERRMLLPPFHGDRMRSYDGLIEEEALAAMATWPDGEEFKTITAFNRITLRVILRAVFGAEGADLKELEQLLPPMATVGQQIVTAPILRHDFGPWSPGRRYARMRRRYDEAIGTLIDKRLADPELAERIDILALMLMPFRESGEPVNRADMADELLTLLLAGHETTSSSLAWTVERLRRHPDVLHRLELEAEGDSSSLRAATILEVQRNRPVIGATGRTVMKPFELGEWRLPPGIRIIALAGLMHTDDRFHPNADSFNPDRYLGSKPDTYAWIPFGGGMRRCLGAAFALFEMDVVLRTMLRHYELLPTTARDERDRFRGVAFAPAKGGLAVVRRRATPLGAGASRVGSADCPAGASRVGSADCPAGASQRAGAGCPASAAFV
jgi:cytochrome P450 family 138